MSYRWMRSIPRQALVFPTHAYPGTQFHLGTRNINFLDFEYIETHPYGRIGKGRNFHIVFQAQSGRAALNGSCHGVGVQLGFAGPSR